MTTTISCAACDHRPEPDDPRPFRCPNGGKDDGDHVLVRKLEGATSAPFFDPEPNPFVRFRAFTHAWHTATRLGMSDGEFVTMVRGLDARVAAVDGGGFRTTPFTRPFDDVWVKDETNNVSGSHKGRHLMGLMIWLLVAERIDPALRGARLAIASCGNAALAAATVARAAERELDVFVPADASRNVVARLESLGARVTVCPRGEGERGDPAYLRFREAVERGALPFTCQGNENGLGIEAGQTLGWELALQLAAAHTPVDDLCIQTGGGALASSCIAGLEEAHGLGVLSALPRVHAVQTLASPLKRAFDRVVANGGDVDEAVQHRSRFMQPWETAPQSVAHGILDDETYDWAAVVRGLLRTGGSVITVSEDRLREANRLARSSTRIAVDHTGSAGLAGLLELSRPGAVLFTGRER